MSDYRDVINICRSSYAVVEVYNVALGREGSSSYSVNEPASERVNRNSRPHDFKS